MKHPTLTDIFAATLNLFRAYDFPEQGVHIEYEALAPDQPTVSIHWWGQDYRPNTLAPDLVWWPNRKGTAATACVIREGILFRLHADLDIDAQGDQ